MGYTHYYRGWVTLSEKLIEDARALAAASGVAIRGWDGTGEPVFEVEHEIRLNGDASADADYETFALTHGVNHSSFCKTGRRPYDVVVAAILLRADYRSRRFKVSSDGDWNDDEWLDARALYLKVFEELPEKPEEMRAARLPSTTKR